MNHAFHNVNATMSQSSPGARHNATLIVAAVAGPAFSILPPGGTQDNDGDERLNSLWGDSFLLELAGPQR